MDDKILQVGDLETVSGITGETQTATYTHRWRSLSKALGLDSLDEEQRRRYTRTRLPAIRKSDNRHLWKSHTSESKESMLHVNI